MTTLLDANDFPPSNGQPKPAILCLHGGGTNKNVFQLQTIRIQRALNAEFEFVFLTAPFDSGPGPDVLPFFEDFGPFFRWVSDRSWTEMPEETKTLVNNVAQAQKAKDGRGFVGVLGFSQGAKLATGLLLGQDVGKGIDWGDGLQFGVICNGTSPPITYGLSEEERSVKITTPTLHLIGKQDPWAEESAKLRTGFCELEKTTLLEFDVGHRLPFNPQDNAKVVAEIRRMYNETSGRASQPTA